MTRTRKSGELLEDLDQLQGQDAQLQQMLGEARQSLRVAQLIYDARTSAGLTQRELAARIGTSPSVISRLERADYRGHSISVLTRIAHALGLTLRIEFAGDHPAARSPAVRPHTRRATA